MRLSENADSLRRNNKRKGDSSCISKLKVDTEKCLLFMYNGEKQGGEKDGKERHTAQEVEQGRKAKDRKRAFGRT
jgi:hypothetical protein